MKNINILVNVLLFCIFLQNNNGIVDFFKNLCDDHSHPEAFLKDPTKVPSEEEESEKESEKNENKENESNEKEKEFKNIKYLTAFEFLSVSRNIGLFRHSEDAKLFTSSTDTETPPPKSTLAV